MPFKLGFYIVKWDLRWLVVRSSYQKCCTDYLKYQDPSEMTAVREIFESIFTTVPFLFNTYSTLINFFSISFIFHTFFRYYQTSHSVVRLAPCDVCCFVLLRVCDSGTVCRQSNFEPVQCMVLAPSNGILSFCCCFRIRYYIIYGIEPHGILPSSEGTPGTVLHALYVRGKRSWQQNKKHSR